MAATASPSQQRTDLSLTEWVVLALLVEAPAHGFAIAKELAEKAKGPPVKKAG